MAIEDKLVNLKDLKVVKDKIDDDVANLKSAIGNNVSEIIKGSYQNNTWSASNTGWTVFLKVTPGAKYSFTSPSGQTSPYAGMRSLDGVPPANGTAADFSTATGWTENRSVASGSTETGTIPDDVNWIEFYSGTNSDPYRRLPVKMIVDGYDYRKTIQANIIGLMGSYEATESDVEVLKDEDIFDKNIYGVYRSEEGYFNEGVWANGNCMVFIKVRPGAHFILTAPASYSSPYAGLTDVSFPLEVGDTENYSSATGWTENRSVTTGETEAGIIPDDVNWLCLYSGITSDPQRRLPIRIIIDGVVYGSSMTGKADINNYVDNLSADNRWNAKRENIRSTAHGGYTVTYPLNSLMAYRDAAVHGFKWVETDIQFTSDNVPVLCHDDGLYTYARNPDGTRVGTSLTDTTFISEITYEQLLYYDFGLAKSPSLAGMKITTFEQLMATARHMGLSVCIEIKKKKLPTYAQLEILFQMADKYHMRNNIEFVSASQYAIADIHKIDPLVSIAFIGSISDWSVRYMLALRGQNAIRIETESAPDSTAIGKAKAANIPVGTGPCSTDNDFLNADPYITFFTSNGPLADEVFRQYEINQM